MTKRYANMAIVYAVIAMVFGVFYREFTKFSDFTGQTRLSVMHTHYFLLGMIFFLVLMLAEKIFAFSDRNAGRFFDSLSCGAECHRTWIPDERADAGMGNGTKQRVGCIYFRDRGHRPYFDGCEHHSSAVEDQKMHFRREIVIGMRAVK